jgi:ABC-type sugar transport system ATPase subunit
MSRVSLHTVSKRFGNVDAIHDIDLTIDDGEFCCFVGPSGCGKSTLLRLIAGLEEPSAGEIRIDDRRVDHLPPAARGVAMVFQSYALYPHMTVYQNMAFGLQQARLGRDVVRERIASAARMLQIEALLERLPRQLSGGQRQRVAIGRAIVREPGVFLFDEPLSNLDAALRQQTRIEIARLHGQLGATMIYVTHDQIEAMTLADKIVVLRDGRVEQVGDPLTLYHHPANRFVAGFIGSPPMNFLQVQLMAAVPGQAELRLADDQALVARVDARSVPVHSVVTLGIRPEHITICAPDVADLRLQVTLCERLGDHSLLLLGSGSGDIMLTAKIAPDGEPAVGETVGVGLPDSHCHLFDARGTACPRVG